LSFDPAGLPPELAALPQFVGWHWELDNQGRWTKVLKNPGSGRKASTTNPGTWSTLAHVLCAMPAFDWDGVGFVFTTNDDYFGIDIDDGYDAAGNLTPETIALIERFGTYAEPSVRRKGVHLIGRTRQVPNEKSGDRSGPRECYWERRFFTLTGAPLPGYDTIAADCTEEFLSWHAETFPPKAAPAPPLIRPALTPDDETIIARVLKMTKGRRLHGDGDMSGLPSGSEADLTLCNCYIAAGATDPAQLDRIFRDSALMRPKWDRTDYRERTLAKALDGHVRPFDGWSTNPIASPARQQRQDAAADASAPVEPAPEGAGCEIQLAIANRRIQALAQENAALRAEVEAYRNRATRSEEIMSRTVSVLGNDRLGQERFTALALSQELGCRRPDEDGWVRMPREAIGARVGIAPDTVSRHSAKLEKLGLIEKKLVRLDEEVNQQTGEIIPARTITLYRVPEAIGGTVTNFQDAVAKADPKQPKAWGGSRPACPDHPHAGTIKRWTIHCAEATCNRVLDTGADPIQNQERQDAATARVAQANQPRNQERQVAAAGFATESPPEPGTASCGAHTPAVVSSSAANRQGWPRVAGAGPAPATPGSAAGRYPESHHPRQPRSIPGPMVSPVSTEDAHDDRALVEIVRLLPADGLHRDRRCGCRSGQNDQSRISPAAKRTRFWPRRPVSVSVGGKGGIDGTWIRNAQPPTRTGRRAMPDRGARVSAGGITRTARPRLPPVGARAAGRSRTRRGRRRRSRTR